MVIPFAGGTIGLLDRAFKGESLRNAFVGEIMILAGCTRNLPDRLHSDVHELAGCEVHESGDVGSGRWGAGVVIAKYGRR